MTTPEMTPIRCERCRAVFALETNPVDAVQCARCQFIFEPQPPAVVGTGGTLGGAASIAVAPVVATTPAAQSSRWTGLLIALIALCLGVAVALGIHLVRSPRASNDLSSLAPVRLAAGEALLWRDDTNSLESAIAAFAEAEALGSQRELAQAERATATMLLGLSLRAEADIFTVAKNTPESARQLEERTTRGERLLREGAALADEVSSHGKEPHSWPVQRAQLLAQALDGTIPDVPADSPAASSPTEPNEGAWRAFCRAVATHTKAEAGNAGGVLSELEFAHRLSPGFRRAEWMLAAQLMSANPPDRARAEQLVTELIRTNADHELALKLKAVLMVSATP